jgi:CheY-like chemotaxis protein
MQRASMDVCPACKRANSASARYCSECGTALVMRCPACDTINTRTRQSCHHCQTTLHEAPARDGPVVPTLVPEDDDAPPAGWRLKLRDNPEPPAPAKAPSSRSPFPIDLPDLPDLPVLLTLSDLPELARPAPPPDLPELPSLRAAMQAAGSLADPYAPTKPARAAGPLTSETPSANPKEAAATAPLAAANRSKPRTSADLATAKAQRRAAVRRSQLRRRPQPTGTEVLDVLVLEAGQPMRTLVCELLEGFGYRPHVAVSVAEAQGLSAKRAYSAAFLGLEDDVSQAAELCRQLHDLPRGRPSAIIAMIDRARHADRVRMQLAGADQVVFRPVGRGDVARSLEACGLALPHDPRLGAQPDA